MSISPWPLLTSTSAFLMLSGLVFLMHLHISFVFVLGLSGLIFCTFTWWFNICLESTFAGCHSAAVRSGLILGMCLFIASEVIFFVSFFWAYFHFALSPPVELGSLWPPIGLVSIPFSSIPLANTVILLTSGLTLT